MESADSTLASLEGIADVYVEMLPMLVNYATMCGLPWGEVLRLHRAVVPEISKRSAILRSPITSPARTYTGDARHVPLARAAGLSDQKIREATSRAMALERCCSDRPFPARSRLATRDSLGDPRVASGARLSGGQL